MHSAIFLLLYLFIHKVFALFKFVKKANLKIEIGRIGLFYYWTNIYIQTDYNCNFV